MKAGCISGGISTLSSNDGNLTTMESANSIWHQRYAFLDYTLDEVFA
jgi:hypothetical protein